MTKRTRHPFIKDCRRKETLNKTLYYCIEMKKKKNPSICSSGRKVKRREASLGRGGGWMGRGEEQEIQKEEDK